ncbi:Stk1 family PASTA domain-containing Ser/Thr kinase [Vagococcus sp. PNs007]|uniref:non-specific serine/threonine protein kinase n=1 Tax=Vagococcus proximus TaxID=2991417 RepID=A0ABT5X3I4_9ENTE|nr:Stk1 family PASTA domain-containing Ser/Thr kinase [Vagococcus proximus]MDF0480556.1 Stk1 family PASTA domain-containing Ser/Thr kinase [Vagococcus proximus]
MIEIGHKINGRYKVLGNIGSGGMSNVFLARDLILDRDVAVKVLRFDFQNDQVAIRRFQREALAASELVHPNVVGVYDVGEENGMQYLVMEYVKGTDLKRYIKDNHPISLDEVVSIMSQILSGISLAHRQRIIHRDLKPQNILLDLEGNVKIADFGIAIALSETSLTQTNTLLGSVHYLSPEQARGGMATRQSDIYALGIILYELLVGNVPFEGESAVSIALKHFQSEVPSVKQVNSEIPQALENVVLHATTKEASDRYETADDMFNDLVTSLNPERANEAVFVPSAEEDQTRVLEPITDDTPMPDSFRQMDGPYIPSTKEGEEDNEEPIAYAEPKKKRGKWWLFLLVLIAGGIAVASFLAFSPKPTIEVPDLKGKTSLEATSILSDLDLLIDSDLKEIANGSVEEGKIVKTNPPAFTRVKPGARVSLYISTGSKKIEIPDFKDKTYQDAYRELADMGFSEKQITKVEQEDDEVPKGTVISQTPEAGAELDPKNDEIELTVSKGAETFVLRGLDGYTKMEVQEYLESKGLLYEERVSYSNAMSEGRVVNQDPPMGTSVSKGDTVTITISLGKEKIEPTATSETEERQTSGTTESKEQEMSSESEESSEDEETSETDETSETSSSESESSDDQSSEAKPAEQLDGKTKD